MDQENTELEQEESTPVNHTRFIALVVLTGFGFLLYVGAIVFLLTR